MGTPKGIAVGSVTCGSSSRLQIHPIGRRDPKRRFQDFVRWIADSLEDHGALASPPALAQIVEHQRRRQLRALPAEQLVRVANSARPRSPAPARCAALRPCPDRWTPAARNIVAHHPGAVVHSAHRLPRACSSVPFGRPGSSQSNSRSGVSVTACSFSSKMVCMDDFHCAGMAILARCVKSSARPRPDGRPS